MQPAKRDNKDHKSGLETQDCDCVKIGQENGLYIATTNVDNYIHRPEIYSSVTLYEWTQSSHKRRATKKELEKRKNGALDSNMTEKTKQNANSYHQFKEGHPMQATHVVKCDFQKLAFVVPNVVGGALPRHDAGNRDYYCCTMLTFFCPWRDASNVKPSTTTWESAFNSYQFSRRQLELMRNFNLQYECLDARDDFHAQLKKKLQSRTPWYKDGDSEVENDEDYVKMPPLGRIDHSVVGKTYGSALKMTDSISSILKKAGWLDQYPEVVANTYERLDPDYVSRTSWAGVVKNCCISIFKERFASYNPPALGAETFNNKSRNTKLVRILTGAYFRRDFIAEKKEANELINACVTEFTLNEEQERAFRIIANHATTTQTEQLKMHLGGMGGTGKTQVLSLLFISFHRETRTIVSSCWRRRVPQQHS